MTTVTVSQPALQVSATVDGVQVSQAAAPSVTVELGIRGPAGTGMNVDGSTSDGLSASGGALRIDIDGLPSAPSS